MSVQTDLLSSLEADHVPELETSAPQERTWEQIQSEQESLRQQLDHAQRLIGEQGRQLGEYRSLLSQRSQPIEQSLPDVSDDDFITNPTKAAEKLLEKKLAPVVSKIQEFENQTRVQEFERKHPEARELLQNQQFVQWANTGPYAYLATNAARGDLDAADALISLYKQSGSEGQDRPVATVRPNGTAPAAGRKPISREKYRQALMRGEHIPPEVMRELQEAYRNKNFV